MMAEIFFHAPTGVVGMAMCNDRQIYRPPRINIKLSLGAVDAFVCECDEFQKNNNWCFSTFKKLTKLFIMQIFKTAIFYGCFCGLGKKRGESRSICSSLKTFRIFSLRSEMIKYILSGFFVSAFNW